MTKSREDLEKKYKDAGIPNVLYPHYGNYMFNFTCDRDCGRCHGSEPGCKNPPIIEERSKYLSWVAERKRFNPPIAKINLFALDFIWRMGNMCFRQYQHFVRVRIDTMTKTEAALIDPTLRQNRIEKIKRYFCTIPYEFQKHVINLSGLTLSREQAKLICTWVEDEFIAVLPMGVMKKMLMTSIALGFLIKRLVPNGDKRMMLMMFHSVFKRTLVRKKSPRRRLQRDRIGDPDFLNAFPPLDH